jgi:hypothetical protein
MSISRRSFLGVSLGASLATVVLAACGGDDGDSGTTGTAGPATSEAGNGAAATSAGGLVAIQFFPPGTFPNVAGQRQRWPFGLGDRNGVVMDSGAPESLEAYVRDLEGAEAGGPLTVPRHNQDLERPYYPLVTELPAGQYQVTFVTPDGTAIEPAFFTVQEPGSVAVPVEGQAMPSFPTPTTAATLDVTPICTQQPPCPFHEVSFDEALASGTPVALLVGTPAYCATGICGPVLGLLESAAAPYGDRLTVIHAEVYTDDTLQTTTGAVQSLGLDYEPSLFVIDASGTLRHRLDVIYDATELAAALTDVAGPA